MTHVERVAVSLPKTLVQMIETFRTRMGLNRSEFYRVALKNYLEEFPSEQEKKIARLYRGIRETDQEILRYFRYQGMKYLPPYQE
jgi:metal-responsive CopG/Arc/MetJ family transcriptional regulator